MQPQPLHEYCGICEEWDSVYRCENRVAEVLVKPTEDQAFAFALMLSAGLPPSDAILYFADTEDTRELAQMVKEWQLSPLTRKAQLQLMKKSWQDMNLDERIKTGLDQHYNNLAYFLFSHNYTEAGTVDKAKLDTARTALEAKMAGTAGKTDALSQFFADINAGRVRLGKSKDVVN